MTRQRSGTGRPSVEGDGPVRRPCPNHATNPIVSPWNQTDFLSLGSSLLGVRPIFSPWGQTDLEFSPLRTRARSSAMRSRLVSPWGPFLLGVFSLVSLGSVSLGSDRSPWVSLGSDRFRSPWGQTDLEFSPLRPRARSSAMRSRLAFDSLWSRAANRADRLGTLSGARGQGSARARRGWPRYGASPGRRGQRGLASGSHARRVGPGRPRTGCTPPRSPGRGPTREADAAPGRLRWA